LPSLKVTSRQYIGEKSSIWRTFYEEMTRNLISGRLESHLCRDGENSSLWRVFHVQRTRNWVYVILRRVFYFIMWKNGIQQRFHV